MLKLALVGILTALSSSGVYWGYRWYDQIPDSTEVESPSDGYSAVKTDFISISVFKDAKVRGYISFRAVLDLKDEADKVEASYIIADTIYRKLSVFSKIFDQGINPKDASLLEAPLLEALQSRLGSEEISSLRLIDLAYDKRL